MFNIRLLLLFCIPFLLSACIVTTVAGLGVDAVSAAGKLAVDSVEVTAKGIHSLTTDSSKTQDPPADKQSD